MRFNAKIGETDRIKKFLETTIMTMKQIACRVGCSETTVSRVNRAHKIRKYPIAGRGEKWIFTATGEEVDL